MGFFYFDESIHERAGFIIGAFVATDEDVGPHVLTALARHGLRPGVDEFKSSANMAGKAALDALREEVRAMVAGCQLALVVAPISERENIGVIAVRGLKQVLEANLLNLRPHTILFDEGIKAPDQSAPDLLALAGLHPDSQVSFGVDSRVEGGIQLADCAAHTAGTVLLEEMGVVRKVVPGRKEDAWDPSEEYEVGFQLWAKLRHALFNSGLPPEPRGDNYFVDVHPHGLYVAPECPYSLAGHAMARFGTAYLGCIR